MPRVVLNLGQMPKEQRLALERLYGITWAGEHVGLPSGMTVADAWAKGLLPQGQMPEQSVYMLPYDGQAIPQGLQPYIVSVDAGLTPSPGGTGMPVGVNDVDPTDEATPGMPRDGSQGYNWPDASRGNAQPGMGYEQVITPVNFNDPAEVARWNALHPDRPLTVGVPPPSSGTSPPLPGTYPVPAPGEGGVQPLPTGPPLPNTPGDTGTAPPQQLPAGAQALLNLGQMTYQQRQELEKKHGIKWIGHVGLPPGMTVQQAWNQGLLPQGQLPQGAYYSSWDGSTAWMQNPELAPYIAVSAGGNVPAPPDFYPPDYGQPPTAPTAPPAEDPGAAPPPTTEDPTTAPPPPPIIADLMAGNPIKPFTLPQGTLRTPGVQFWANASPFERNAIKETVEFQGVNWADWEAQRNRLTKYGVGALTPGVYGTGINPRGYM